MSATATKKPAAKKKPAGRTARWNEATNRADTLRDQLLSTAQELADTLSDLRDLQSEYAEWRDNLPESLQSSAVADKLNAIIDDIDIPDGDGDVVLETWDQVTEAIEAALNADLPLGFGRD